MRGERGSLFSATMMTLKTLTCKGEIFILRVTTVLSSLSFAEWLEFPGQRGNLGRGTCPRSRKWQHPGIMGVQLRTPWKGFQHQVSLSEGSSGRVHTSRLEWEQRLQPHRLFRRCVMWMHKQNSGTPTLNYPLKQLQKEKEKPQSSFSLTSMIFPSRALWF